MAGSLHVATFKRQVETHQLEFDGGLSSQWLDAATFRSAFCVAVNSTAAAWTIEVLLPSAETVAVALYDAGNLFNPVTPRYITTNAMCGLPIRFVADQAQPGSKLWVVFKS